MNNGPAPVRTRRVAVEAQVGEHGVSRQCRGKRRATARANAVVVQPKLAEGGWPRRRRADKGGDNGSAVVTESAVTRGAERCARRGAPLDVRRAHGVHRDAAREAPP